MNVFCDAPAKFAAELSRGGIRVKRVTSDPRIGPEDSIRRGKRSFLFVASPVPLSSHQEILFLLAYLGVLVRQQLCHIIKVEIFFSSFGVFSLRHDNGDSTLKVRGGSIFRFNPLQPHLLTPIPPKETTQNVQERKLKLEMICYQPQKLLQSKSMRDILKVKEYAFKFIYKFLRYSNYDKPKKNQLETY